MTDNTIYTKLKKDHKPFFVLAPMDDVTGTVFRRVVAKYAPADLMVTEFANVDGWCSAGRDATESRVTFTKSEKPLIAQIWGITPEHYKVMAADMVARGFDGVDINMGCPVKDVVKKGACSALILNRPLAEEIITATQEGLQGKIPLSVKTRIGFNEVQTEYWISFLLSFGLDALTVHGRTKQEMSKVPADWGEIKKAVELKNSISPNTTVIGNGDVLSREDGLLKAKESGVDGIMIGRGIFQNFFVFANTQPTKDLGQMLSILAFHTKLHQEQYDGAQFEPLKKFIKMYVNGFKQASEYRNTLMLTSSHDDLLAAIDKIQKSL